MVEHLNQSQPNPGLRPDESYCSQKENWICAPSQTDWIRLQNEEQENAGSENDEKELEDDAEEELAKLSDGEWRRKIFSADRRFSTVRPNEYRQGKCRIENFAEKNRFVFGETEQKPYNMMLRGLVVIDVGHCQNKF